MDGSHVFLTRKIYLPDSIRISINSFTSASVAFSRRVLLSSLSPTEIRLPVSRVMLSCSRYSRAQLCEISRVFVLVLSPPDTTGAFICIRGLDRIAQVCKIFSCVFKRTLWGAPVLEITPVWVVRIDQVSECTGATLSCVIPPVFSDLEKNSSTPILWSRTALSSTRVQEERRNTMSKLSFFITHKSEE